MYVYVHIYTCIQMYIHMYRHGRTSSHVRGADFADVSIEKGGRDDQRRTHDEIGCHDKVKEVHLHTQTDVCMYAYAYSCVYMYMHM